MFDIKEKANKPIVEYLERKKVVILEDTVSIVTSVKKLMSDLGIPILNITIADDLEKAILLVSGSIQHIVIATKEFRGLNTLPLYEAHLKRLSNRSDSFFFWLSNDNSMATSAIVLDYEMEGLIIKPFTVLTFQEEFLKIVKNKMNPDEYLKILELGKSQLREGQLAEAEISFNKTLSLNPKLPSSKYHLAKIFELQQKLVEAETFYNEILNEHPDHYQSLVSLAKINFDRKDYKTCYEIYTKILEKYPLNPDKIPILIRLAIINNRFNDIIGFAKIFSEIETNSVEIKKYLSAALVTCGKYLFSIGEKNLAVDTLVDSLKLSNHKQNIFDSVVRLLAQNGRPKKALSVLAEYASKDMTEQEFRLYELEIVNTNEKDPLKVLALGAKLLNSNANIKVVFEIMIKRSVEANKNSDYIKELVYSASKAFPDDEKLFYTMANISQS